MTSKNLFFFISLKTGLITFYRPIETYIILNRTNNLVGKTAHI
jgi:hypothetical protein